MYLEKTLTSLEIAEMVGREHKNVMQDIRILSSQLDKLDLQPIEYFIESSYIDSLNRKKPSFKLTKIGCELYGTRMTGLDGTAFAAKYAKRFNEMENELKQHRLPQNYKEALLHLIEQVEVNEKLEEQLQLQAPKVVVADAITASSNSILIRDLAKILAQNGAVNVGEKRLFSWMRNNGYLTQKNVPTQRSIEMGIMELHERPVVMKDNQIKTYITPRISGKGQSYFIKKFLFI